MMRLVTPDFTIVEAQNALQHMNLFALKNIHYSGKLMEQTIDISFTLPEIARKMGK